jgi:TRAP-type C4-dicarboxylate transport system permease small subunit
MLGTILIVAAFILALLEAVVPFVFRAPTTWVRPHLGWLAVALYFLALVLGSGGGRL